MNNDVIYDAVSGVDEVYLSAADNADAVRNSFKKNRARKTKIIGSVVCCAALVLAAGWISTQNWFGKTPSVMPEETANAGAQPADPAQSSEDRQPTAAEEHPVAPDIGAETPASDGETDAQTAENGAVMAPEIPASFSQEASSQSEGNGPIRRAGDPPIQYRTLVETYGDAAPEEYGWIGPGEHVISKALAGAIAEYGADNVTYRLRLTVYYEPLGKMTPDEQRAFYQAEADRFGLSDKAIFVIESFKNDRTGEETVTFSAHLYDPSFLEEFPDNPGFGYLIELFGEG